MRTLIIEDSGYMADSLLRLLTLLPELAVVAKATSRDEALHAAAAHQPQLVILDLRIKDSPAGVLNPEHGITTLRTLRQQQSELKVLVLSSMPEQPWLRIAAEAGADGFVSKDSSSEAIVTALQAISGGAVAFTPAQLRLLRSAAISLSPREREVLALLDDGLSNQQIGQRLGISPDTARKHVEHLCDLFAVRSRGQVVAAARRQGLL